MISIFIINIYWAKDINIIIIIDIYWAEDDLKNQY